MPYASTDILVDRFGAAMLVALTDRAAEATGEIDAAVVDRALADADAVIDGYLAGRYALPLASAPALLVDIAAAIAIWKLHLCTPDARVEADYKDALRRLRDIADGRLRIPGAAGVEPAVTGGQGARITDRERPMTEATLKGFI
jgi:phage gp36-like protein